MKITELSWMDYNAFEYSIKFNSWEVDILHNTISSPFFFYELPTILNGIYNWAWSLPWGVKYSWNIEAISFFLKSLSQVTSTFLDFTTKTGAVLSFWIATTDDGGSIAYATGGNDWGKDILTAVYPATYTFVPLPCVPDVTNPTITWIDPINGSRYIPNNQVVSFTVYDWAGAGSVSWPSPLATNNTSHYWYQGLATGVLSNYVAAPVTVDNQEGVNSSTIKATVSCPTCTSFGGPYVLTASNLVISDWLGDWSRHQYTWNSKRRGYDVSFAAPAAYEVEKTVNVVFEAVDNSNETWAIHTGTASISFNAPQNPIITRLLPSTDTFVSPSKLNPIRLFISDDWAGIDTGSVKITIPKIMSWAEQLMTGYTYSWSELSFTLSWWASGLWNSGKYIVDFYPLWDFPANETVVITWSASDLANNVYSTFTTSFTTRPDCSFFGCNEILNINILDGNFAWSFDFTWTILVVTWTNPNSPYPYLTWLNNDILMCWVEWTWAVLTWNVTIYDSSNNQINWNLYTGNALYITGLNFTIVDWVIIVQ